MPLFSKVGKPIWVGQMLGSLCQTEALIGLDIGSHTVKLVQLTSKGRKWQLQCWGMKSLPWPRCEVDGGNSETGLEDAIKELLLEEHIHQTHVACSIRGPSVMVKTIQVPIMTASELEEHLGWEMDQYIPSNVKDIYWDYHIPNRGHQEASEAMMAVLVVAAKKEAVHKRVDLLHRCGLKPLVLDVDNLGLSNMYAFNYADCDSKRILVIQVSPSGLGMIVMNEGYPMYMREIEVGGDGYRDLMEHTMRSSLNENLSGDASQSSDFPKILLEGVYKEVLKEINKTIEYCCEMVPPHQIQKLFLCGGYSRLPGLAKTIEAELNLPLEFIDPFKKLDVLSDLNGRESLQSFGLLGGVAIGLALRGISD